MEVEQRQREEMDRVREELYLEEQEEFARQKELVRISLSTLLKSKPMYQFTQVCQFKSYANVK